MGEANLLTAVDLKKYYPIKEDLLGRPKVQVKAVDGVTFSIKAGETLGLVGESGCGKSTLGRCLLRLEEPTAGKVFLEDLDLSTTSPKQLRSLRRELQMIFQDPYSSLNPRRKVGDIIGEAFAIHGLLSKPQRREKVKELIEIVGLQREHYHRYPHEFSGGQRQRIGIARALSLNPRLVIADEPVSALDVSVQAQVLNLLVQLQDRFGLTYIFVTHNLSVVRHISNRLAVMYLGRLVELGETKRIFESPHHPYTQALIAAVPGTIRLLDRKVLLEGDVPSPVNPPTGCRFHPRCPFRRAICAQEDPSLSQVEPGHQAACHFLEPDS